MSNDQHGPEADRDPQGRKRRRPSEAGPSEDPPKEPTAIARFEEAGAGIAAKE